jgi:hypothetical protein
VDAPADRVGDGARLLEDLFEHEVFVAAFRRGDRVPAYDGNRLIDRRTVEAGAAKAVAGHNGHLLVVEEGHSTGVVQNSWQIGGYEGFAVAKANRHAASVTEPRDDESIWLANAHQDDRVISPQLDQGAARGDF